MAPRIAIIAFPGTNNEVESIRAIKRAGMEARCVKWNDPKESFADCDGYFLVGGFCYEDRGRAGMVAARDPLLQFLHDEAEKGKVVLGHCNGAQILVESGLIPLDANLRMSLARNAVRHKDTFEAVGFLNEWIWITPTCKRDRCASSDWSGVMQIPIAHGEGRYVTREKDLIQELEKNDQIAFRYCNAQGTVSDDPTTTPNGATSAIAGICNPRGNIVALMPHPERSTNGDPYFASVKAWIETSHESTNVTPARTTASSVNIRKADDAPVEIFIATIITNNEERTVEQAARRVIPTLSLTQYRYIRPTNDIASVLSSIVTFNPNKEIAYVRKDSTFYRFDATTKSITPHEPIFRGIPLVRFDEPQTENRIYGKGGTAGICYDVDAINDADLQRSDLLEVFANPHASHVERLT